MFGVEQAMYSVMTYYIAFKTIDTVIQGLDETKAVLIVSDHMRKYQTRFCIVLAVELQSLSERWLHG